MEFFGKNVYRRIRINSRLLYEASPRFFRFICIYKWLHIVCKIRHFRDFSLFFKHLISNKNYSDWNLNIWLHVITSAICNDRLFHFGMSNHIVFFQTSNASRVCIFMCHLYLQLCVKSRHCKILLGVMIIRIEKCWSHFNESVALLRVQMYCRGNNSGFVSSSRFCVKSVYVFHVDAFWSYIETRDLLHYERARVDERNKHVSEAQTPIDTPTRTQTHTNAVNQRASCGQTWIYILSFSKINFLSIPARSLSNSVSYIRRHTTPTIYGFVSF